MRKENWGRLFDRYNNKDQPRRILSVDGGGIRGIVALGILAQIEKQLAKVTGMGPGFRLCEYFDFIGGTSTGAIIAAGLARGKSVKQILSLYQKKGKDMFDPAVLMRLFKYKYKAGKLKEELQKFYGADTCLYPEHLQSLLLTVMMNVDTDSPWPLSSNPDAKYNNRNRKDCNLDIPLWQLVRASAAAPFFFGHEEIQIDDKSTFAFVDGGVTPHNNPAWLMYRMATLPQYKLNWKAGEKNLLIVSVGTGRITNVGRYENVPDVITQLSKNLLNTMKEEKDINCRQFGRCTYGYKIDRELGDMIPKQLPADGDSGKAFLYCRYDAEYTNDWLRAKGLNDINLKEVQKIDGVDHIEDLARIGTKAGEDVDVKSHFEHFATKEPYWPMQKP